MRNVWAASIILVFAVSAGAQDFTDNPLRIPRKAEELLPNQFHETRRSRELRWT